MNLRILITVIVGLAVACLIFLRQSAKAPIAPSPDEGARLSLEQLSHDAEVGHDSSSALISHGGKLLFLGTQSKNGSSGNSAMWTSTDGSRWQQHPHPPPFIFTEETILLKHPEKLIFLSNSVDQRELKIWSFSSNQGWELRSPNLWHKGPERRYGQKMLVKGRSLFLMGGRAAGSNHWLRDVWRSDDSGKSWLKVSEDFGFTNRYQHSALVYMDHILVLGGREAHTNHYLGDLWQSKDGSDWRRVWGGNDALKRDGHKWVSASQGLLLMGGRQPVTNAYLKDVWRLNSELQLEMLTENSGMPDAYGGHFLSLGSEGIVYFGGKLAQVNTPQQGLWFSSKGQKWQHWFGKQWPLDYPFVVAPHADGLLMIGSSHPHDPQSLQPVWWLNHGVKPNSSGPVAQ